VPGRVPFTPINSASEAVKMDVFGNTQTDLGSIGDYTLADTQTIGATSVKILDAQKRKEFSLVNTSTGGQIISLTFGMKAAVALTGIVLSPGQTYIASDDSGFKCYEGPISAIASAAGATIAIFVR